MNFIVGAGGFAKEVAWLFNEIESSNGGTQEITAFIADDQSTSPGDSIHGIPVISESFFFQRFQSNTCNLYIGVGDGSIRRNIFQKYQAHSFQFRFPRLIHPSVSYDRRSSAISIAQGAIVCAGVILTTDIDVQPFVQLNLGCTVGHDSIIGAFSTLSPGVHISGKVHVGDNCFFGTNASVIESIRIANESIIGAGATVIRNITESGTYLGTPAKRIPAK